MPTSYSAASLGFWLGKHDGDDRAGDLNLALLRIAEAVEDPDEHCGGCMAVREALGELHSALLGLEPEAPEDD